MHSLYLFLILLTATSVVAQPKNCDKWVQSGDTTICQNFKKDRLSQEDFYLQGKQIFARQWYYRKDGTYNWQQKKKKGAKAEGPSEAYYADGSVQAIGYFSNGKQVKDCLEFYPSGAIKLRCYHNEQGKKDGVRMTYYENGRLQSQARWENGLLREILKYKDEKGQDLAVGSFQNGTGDWIWYEKGQPAYRYIYQDGREKKKQKMTAANVSK